MEIREDVPLAPYTTFEIGGPARWFLEASDEDDVLDAVLFAQQKQLPLLVLGGGSNLLIADTGFPGVVLHMHLSGITAQAAGQRGRAFTVGAGEKWDAFVSYAVEQGCAGVECLAGIPGTTGGTPIQNVGAYGQEVSSVISKVRALDRSSMTYVDLENDACQFAYRTSIFNSTHRDRYIVTSVHFELFTHTAPLLRYKDLALYFEHRSVPPSLTEVAAAVRTIRQKKGMLLVPGEADCRSAGSFFKNPLVSAGALEALAASLGVSPETIPHFPGAGSLGAAGNVKVPAAWLIEKAGFERGYRLGRAGISTRHTLALVNTGGASATEVLALRDEIAGRVQERFGITLETEPVMVRP